MSKVQLMLTEVNGINEKYKKIAEVTGSNFNIFNILDLQSKEVKHSMFIAELLNSRGLHNQGSVFFNIFIDCLNEVCNVENIELTSLKKVNYQVLIEESKGGVDEINAFGGRLDIVIKAENGIVLIIENKIDAKDQALQLKRYKNEYRDSILLYLTLDGKDADDISKSDLQNNQDYFCISYKEVIMKWIEKGIAISTHKPFIRENLTQYLQVIKSITNQAETMEQSNEVINAILKNKENFEAANVLTGEFDKAKVSLFEGFWNDVEQDLKNIHKLTVSFHVHKEQKCALWIRTNNQDTLIGVEPLNDWYLKNTNTFIGTFNLKKEKDRWTDKKDTQFDFRSIEKTLGKILPNTSSRENVKKDLIKTIVDYIYNLKNEIKPIYS